MNMKIEDKAIERVEKWSQKYMVFIKWLIKKFFENKLLGSIFFIGLGTWSVIDGYNYWSGIQKDFFEDPFLNRSIFTGTTSVAIGFLFLVFYFLDKLRGKGRKV